MDDWICCMLSSIICCMPPIHASPVVGVLFHLVVTPPGLAVVSNRYWSVIHWWCGVVTLHVGAVSGGCVGAS